MGLQIVVMEKLPLSLPQASPLLLNELNAAGPQTRDSHKKDDLLQVVFYTFRYGMIHTCPQVYLPHAV